MRNANKSEFGNMEWQARHFGYNDAKYRPTVADINQLISQMPNARFTSAQQAELLESADYAYMMRLKHYQHEELVARGQVQPIAEEV